VKTPVRGLALGKSAEEEVESGLMKCPVMLGMHRPGVVAVMDAMGHGSVNTTRIYTHSNVQQITEAIERRNQLSRAPVEAVQ
jgi:hypothetical protein